MTTTTTPRTAKFHGTARTGHYIYRIYEGTTYLGHLYLTEADYHETPCSCDDDLSRCGPSTNQLANRKPFSYFWSN